MDAFGNEWIVSGLPHHQSLEMSAAAALADRDFATAYRYADRRCRSEPPPLAHCHVLRAEAAFQLGFREAAIADLGVALEISPSDITAARRMLAWGDGLLQLRAAKSVVCNDRDFNHIGAALKVLQAAGEYCFATASIFDATVTGWAVWDSDEPASLSIRSADGEVSTACDPDPFFPLSSANSCATAFSIDRPLSAEPQVVSISVGGKAFFVRRLPPNATADATASRRTALPRPSKIPAPATVIVPVYADFTTTRACLESLLVDDQLGAQYQVILVNDASPEREIAEYLESVSTHPAIRLLVNDLNLGFVGSINRALKLVGEGDVVLLNADTIVPPGFVGRLAEAAQSSKDIGTVVPLSNNGEVTNFPAPFSANPMPDKATLLDIDRAAASCNKGRVIDVPNGTGFCLYITRSCLDAVGALSESFQRGYLEDIEFCLRARERGFRNVCAPSVYVGHVGSTSFKTEKRSLVLRNLGIVDHRFPLFRSECASFIAADPMRSCREAMERSLPTHRPSAVLIVDGVGATRAVAARRIEQLLAAGQRPMLLRHDLTGSKSIIAVASANEGAPQTLSFDLASGADEFRDYLTRLQPTHCEIIDSSIVSTSLLQTFRDVAVPCDVWVADGNSFAAFARPGCECDQASATTTDTRLRMTRRVLAPCDQARSFAERVVPGFPTDMPFKPTASRRRRRSRTSGKDRRLRCIAIVPTRCSASEFATIRSIASRFRAAGSDRKIVVTGPTIDDVRLMSCDNVFVTGPVDASDLDATMQIYDAGWILAGFDGPLFGHPLIDAARTTGLPMAQSDWSRGDVAVRRGDLGLEPELSVDELANALLRWTEGA